MDDVQFCALTCAAALDCDTFAFDDQHNTCLFVRKGTASTTINVTNLTAWTNTLLVFDKTLETMTLACRTDPCNTKCANPYYSCFANNNSIATFTPQAQHPHVNNAGPFQYLPQMENLTLNLFDMGALDKIIAYRTWFTYVTNVVLKDVFNLTSTRLSYIVNNTSVRSLVVRTFNFTSIDLANDDTKGLLDALNGLDVCILGRINCSTINTTQLSNCDFVCSDTNLPLAAALLNETELCPPNETFGSHNVCSCGGVGLPLPGLGLENRSFPDECIWLAKYMLYGLNNGTDWSYCQRHLCECIPFVHNADTYLGELTLCEWLTNNNRPSIPPRARLESRIRGQLFAYNPNFPRYPDAGYTGYPYRSFPVMNALTPITILPHSMIIFDSNLLVGDTSFYEKVVCDTIDPDLTFLYAACPLGELELYLINKCSLQAPACSALPPDDTSVTFNASSSNALSKPPSIKCPPRAPFPILMRNPNGVFLADRNNKAFPFSGPAMWGCFPYPIWPNNTLPVWARPHVVTPGNANLLNCSFATSYDDCLTKWPITRDPPNLTVTQFDHMWYTRHAFMRDANYFYNNGGSCVGPACFAGNFTFSSCKSNLDWPACFDSTWEVGPTCQTVDCLVECPSPLPNGGVMGCNGQTTADPPAPPSCRPYNSTIAIAATDASVRDAQGTCMAAGLRLCSKLEAESSTKFVGAPNAPGYVRTGEYGMWNVQTNKWGQASPSGSANAICCNKVCRQPPNRLCSTSDSYYTGFSMNAGKFTGAYNANSPPLYMLQNATLCQTNITFVWYAPFTPPNEHTISIEDKFFDYGLVWRLLDNVRNFPAKAGYDDERKKFFVKHSHFAFTPNGLGHSMRVYRKLQAQGAPCYTTDPDINYIGNDIKEYSSITPQECETICNNEPECKGFVNNDQNSCWLKREMTSFEYYGGLTSHIKGHYDTSSNICVVDNADAFCMTEQMKNYYITNLNFFEYPVDPNNPTAVSYFQLKEFGPYGFSLLMQNLYPICNDATKKDLRGNWCPIDFTHNNDPNLRPHGYFGTKLRCEDNHNGPANYSMQQLRANAFLDPRIVRWEGTVTITLLSSNATAACVQTPIDVITRDMLCTMDGPVLQRHPSWGYPSCAPFDSYILNRYAQFPFNYNTSIGLTRFKPDPNYPYIYDPMYPKENFMVNNVLQDQTNWYPPYEGSGDGTDLMAKGLQHQYKCMKWKASKADTCAQNFSNQDLYPTCEQVGSASSQDKPTKPRSCDLADRLDCSANWTFLSPTFATTMQCMKKNLADGRGLQCWCAPDDVDETVTSKPTMRSSDDECVSRDASVYVRGNLTDDAMLWYPTLPILGAADGRRTATMEELHAPSLMQGDSYDFCDSAWDMNSSWRNNFGHNIFNKSQQASIQVDGRQLKLPSNHQYNISELQTAISRFCLETKCSITYLNRTGDDSIEPFSYTYDGQSIDYGTVKWNATHCPESLDDMCVVDVGTNSMQFSAICRGFEKRTGAWMYVDFVRCNPNCTDNQNAEGPLNDGSNIFAACLSWSPQYRSVVVGAPVMADDNQSFYFSAAGFSNRTYESTYACGQNGKCTPVTPTDALSFANASVGVQKTGKAPLPALCQMWNDATWGYTDNCTGKTLVKNCNGLWTCVSNERVFLANKPSIGPDPGARYRDTASAMSSVGFVEPSVLSTCCTPELTLMYTAGSEDCYSAQEPGDFKVVRRLEHPGAPLWPSCKANPTDITFADFRAPRAARERAAPLRRHDASGAVAVAVVIAVLLAVAAARAPAQPRAAATPVPDTPALQRRLTARSTVRL